MKKIITITLLFVGLFSFAQPPLNGKMRDKIKAQKAAFITDKLSLTTEEAEKFWPIYNAYEEVTQKIKAEYFRPIKRHMHKNGATVSDSEASKLLDQLMEGENKMHAAKVKLVNDLKTAIPAQKIIKLKPAEEAFNRKLLKQLRNFRENRKN